MSAGNDPTPAPGTLNASPDQLEAIREHVEAIYPEEACGGLIGRVSADGTAEVLEIVPASNVRTDERARRYLIGPREVLDIERRADAAGLQVIGYYHSHPDHPAEPSESDREHAWPWYVYLIASVEEGRMSRLGAWRLSDDRDAFHPVPLGDARSSGGRAD